METTGEEVIEGVVDEVAVEGTTADLGHSSSSFFCALVKSMSHILAKGTFLKVGGSQ